MIHRFLEALVVLTFFLLFAGGLVTSTDSGLAVPDWPLSFGGLFPPMVGGVRFEHTHRVIASAVGLLTLILTIWIGRTEKRPRVRQLAVATLGAVVLQGILGGMTVLYQLPAPISVAHACIGPIFFSVVVALAILIQPVGAPLVGARQGGWAGTRPAPTTVHTLTVLAVFIQILLGAIVRHTSRFIWLHALWTFVVLGVTAWVVSRSWSRTALFLGFFVTLEFFLGIGTFIFTRIQGIESQAGKVFFPTIHQTLGALLLATAVALALKESEWQGTH